MTALPIPSSPTADAPLDPREWIPFQEAAAKLGVHPDALSRRCRDQLERFHSAQRVKDSTDRKARWFIARRLDARLWPNGLGDEEQEPDLSRYTDKQRQDMMDRVACVQAYRDARARARQAESAWFPTLVSQLQKQYPSLSLSAVTVRRWNRIFKRCRDKVKLIDRRGHNERAEPSPEVKRFFYQLYADCRQYKIIYCHEQTESYALQLGHTWVSYAQLCRKLDGWFPPAEVLKTRDPAQYKAKYAPFIQQHSERFVAGKTWLADHTQLDLWCMYPGQEKPLRPWLTTFMDGRTRRVTGWRLAPSPNSGTILDALKMGLQDPMNFGGPDQVWLDNGRDFVSYTFIGRTKQERIADRKLKVQVDEDTAAGCFKLLSIEPHFSLPYGPDGKGRLERFFGYLHDRFDRTFVTYCGKGPEDKPADLEDILKNKREIVPSFDHVEGRITNFLRGYNANASHNKGDMKGLSPDAALDQWCPSKRVMRDPAALDLCLQKWFKPVTVGKNGVTVSPRGVPVSYGQYTDELKSYKGREVRAAYDHNDARLIRVFTLEGDFIAELKMNEVRRGNDPMSENSLAAAMRESKQYKKAKDYVRKNRMLELQTMVEIAGQNQRRQAPKESTARDMKIVQTPLDGQAEKLEKHRMRKAAGAEAMTRDDDFSILDRLANLPLPNQDLDFSEGSSILDNLVLGEPIK